MTAIPRLLLGVDTGGTYTDAVLLDADRLTVESSAKAVTTRGDLAVGVAEAIDRAVAGVDPAGIELVSLSTTLATNAVVEDQGSPVLAVLVGFDESMVDRSGVRSAFSDAIVIGVAGGHDHYGNEKEPLDVDSVGRALLERAGAIEAVAITSAFAVRNPDHETRLRELVLSSTDLPVTISTELSDELDAPRRALTTVLNARLLSRITGLVGAVTKSLRRHGIDAPLTIAKGDGSLAVADAVARRPIETILSGPAASVVGAGILAGNDDCIVADIGGTTTDIGAVAAGRPRLLDSGALVGGWRTMVRAIDVRTTGLGGDSEVSVGTSGLTVGPRRHVPIALLAQKWPEVLELIATDISDHPPREYAGQFVLWPEAGGRHESRSAIERRLSDRIGSSPQRLRDVADGSVERRVLAAMAQRGDVQIGGFTPSDAAHVLGWQDNWSRPGAQLGAELLAWYTAETAESFSRRIWSETVRRSSVAVLEVALADEAPVTPDDPIIDAAADGSRQVGRVDVRLSPRDPIVAVGGPAAVYYPAVGDRLEADIVVPDDFAVANAVGAAAGRLVGRASVELSADGPGVFRLVGGDAVEVFADASAGVERASEVADARARAALAELAEGLPEIGPVEVDSRVERHDEPGAVGDEGLYLLRIHAEAAARPFAH